MTKARSTGLWHSALRQTLVVLGIAAIPSGISLLFDLKWEAPAEFAEFKSSGTQADTESFIWIDVRSRERFESARIPSAIHFEEPFSSAALENIRSQRRSGKKIVVYGEGAGSDRALRAARLLKKELPEKNVLLLQGGWAGWKGHKTSE
jgi:rhodanese-related sulfurtransferase